MTKNQSLPIGFNDVLFDKCEENHRHINLAVEFFLKKGFRLIKPSLVEFTDIDSAKDFESFDPLSGKKITFRSDITKQITRIFNSRLGNHKLPMKLCYYGDVLCKNNDDLQGDRQQTQIGIEIIGYEDHKNEELALKMILETLSKIKVKNLIIEFSFPKLLNDVFQNLKVTKKDDLIKAIKAKDLSQVKKIVTSNYKSLEYIICNNSNLKELAKAVADLNGSTNSCNHIKKANNLHDFLGKKYPKIKCCFDLFGDDDLGYHTDFSFDIFTDSSPYKIASGGVYEIAIGSKKNKSIGSTIYLNRL